MLSAFRLEFLIMKFKIFLQKCYEQPLLNWFYKKMLNMLPLFLKFSGQKQKHSLSNGTKIQFANSIKMHCLKNGFMLKQISNKFKIYQSDST
ncbi:hypothetical protein BpHYR1_004420 [Brachionus plicatilis]|uniref:Uncharacterized protein n=1 Tax=Brachionus plicatilis TaxID=10195 RepID=A0A3M7T418_BRAPC|nr:hypothetical protein BpHYR1_004420 [Brachionus plicatilis]